MKTAHLYQRLNNQQAIRVLLNMIKTSEQSIAKELLDNLTNEASDHPHYNNLKAAYEQRFGNYTPVE